MRGGRWSAAAPPRLRIWRSDSVRAVLACLRGCQKSESSGLLSGVLPLEPAELGRLRAWLRVRRPVLPGSSAILPRHTV